MKNIKLNTIQLCKKNIDILNEQLKPNQKNKTYKGLKHLKCCSGQVTGDIDNIPPEKLLLCKIVCVGRSIVRRFNFDYFKYICSREVSCLGRGKNIITKNNPWFNNSNIGNRINLVEGLDFQHAEYPIRLIDLYTDLLNMWGDSSCQLSQELSVIFPDIGLIKQWYNVILEFRQFNLTLMEFSEKLTKVMVGDVLELQVQPPPPPPTELVKNSLSMMKRHTMNTFTFDRFRPQKEPNALGSIMSIFEFITDPFDLGQELNRLVQATQQKNLKKLMKEYPAEKLLLCSMKNTDIDIFDFKTGSSLRDVWDLGQQLEEGKMPFIQPLTPAQVYEMIPQGAISKNREGGYKRPSMVTRTKKMDKKSIPYELEFKFFRGKVVSSSVKEKVTWLLTNSLYGKKSTQERYCVAIFLPGPEYRMAGGVTIDKEGNVVKSAVKKTQEQIRIISKDPRFPRTNSTRVESKTRVHRGYFNFYNEQTKWVNKLWDGTSFKAEFSTETDLGGYNRFMESNPSGWFYADINGGNAELFRYIERDSWDMGNWRIDVSTVYQVSGGSSWGWWSKIQDGEIVPKYEIEIEFTGKMKNYSNFDGFRKEISDIIMLVMDNTSVCY